MIINETKFPIYGIIILISVILGLLYVCMNLKKEKVHPIILFYFVITFISFAIFGSLAISNIIRGEFSLNSYSGAISLIICSLMFNKIVPKDNIYLKYSIISFPLIYGVGKIGCFLAGCCYGLPYDGALSVTYTSGLNIPLFPIQLLEAIVFISLFFIINVFKNKKDITYFTIVICCLIKFLLDFLRYDHASKLITTNQIISVTFIVVSLLLLIKRNLKK